MSSSELNSDKHLGDQVISLHKLRREDQYVRNIFRKHLRPPRAYDHWFVARNKRYLLGFGFLVILYALGLAEAPRVFANWREHGFWYYRWSFAYLFGLLSFPIIIYLTHLRPLRLWQLGVGSGFTATAKIIRVTQRIHSNGEDVLKAEVLVKFRDTTSSRRINEGTYERGTWLTTVTPGEYLLVLLHPRTGRLLVVAGPLHDEHEERALYDLHVS